MGVNDVKNMKNSEKNKGTPEGPLGALKSKKC